MVESVDPRIIDCQRKIKKNNAKIEADRQKISELNADIDDLKELRVKYVNFQNELDNSVSKSENQINNIVGFVFNFFSTVKSTFFSSLINVIKGPQLTVAKNSLESSIQKIDDQIYKNQNEIDDLQKEISSLIANNLALNLKISEYKKNPLVTM